MNENDERKWIIGIIEEGQKSDYWKLLKGSIREWIVDENKRLDYCKKSGIVGRDEMEKYNRTVDRLEYLKRLLTINETIINYHKSWLEKFKEKVEEISDIVGESFVKNFRK